ncbi:hypothetical protein QQ045_012655 [Rhodiola kirilowii]
MSNTPASTTIAASSKMAVPAAKSIDTQFVLKREISAFPEDNIFITWKGTIAGIKDAVFEDTKYKLSLSFPAGYPLKSPKDMMSGPYLSPSRACSKNQIRGHHALNNQAAAMWSNQEEYRKMVIKLYKPSA